MFGSLLFCRVQLCSKFCPLTSMHSIFISHSMIVSMKDLMMVNWSGCNETSPKLDTSSSVLHSLYEYMFSVMESHKNVTLMWICCYALDPCSASESKGAWASCHKLMDRHSPSAFSLTLQDSLFHQLIQVILDHHCSMFSPLVDNAFNWFFGLEMAF